MITQPKLADLFQGEKQTTLLYRPEAISRIIERLYTTHYVPAEEQRNQSRYPLSIEVVVCPVNERLERQEESFKAMTRDISAGGLSLMHTRWIMSKFLAVKLVGPDGEPRIMILKNIRNRMIGSFYEIAGNFVTNLSLSPPTKPGCGDIPNNS